MKNKIIIAVITISITLLSGIIFAGAILENFAAYPLDNSIKLEWDSKQEIDLMEYQIERSATGGDFVYIGSVVPRGDNNHYIYLDETVFTKITDRTYSYRIKILDKDESFTYSSVITVTPVLSAARETWGSIKALFR